MLKTRIYPVTGFHVDVQESVDEVRELVFYAGPSSLVKLTLESGEPVYLMRSHIVYFKKY